MKSAISFAIEFPQEHGDLKSLVAHLNETCESLRFKPLSEHAPEAREDEDGFTFLMSTEGLVPMFSDDDAPLFELLPNGFAFAVKMEDKVIPPSALETETQAAASRITKATGVTPTRKELDGLRDTVRGTLAARALSVTKGTRAVYHWDSKRLLVPVGSKSVAQRVVRTLLKAFPSVKSKTIHVNSLKDGLATRLEAWVNNDNQTDEGAFAPLLMGDKVTLKGAEGKKVIVDAGKVGINDFREILRNAMGLGGMKVESIRLEDESGIGFTLTHDFTLKGISLSPVDAPEDAEDAKAITLHMVACQLTEVSHIVDRVVEMFGWNKDATTGEGVKSEGQ